MSAGIFKKKITVHRIKSEGSFQNYERGNKFQWKTVNEFEIH
jgi:hypothetical protein